MRGGESVKELMDGYVGVKFKAVVARGVALPQGFSDLFPEFKHDAEILKQHGMTPKNGGNMSRRFAQGFVLTTSGCNLGVMEPDELVYVVDCSLESEEVRYAGPREPSSEAILHHLSSQDRPDAGAVMHAHDPVATAEIIAGEVPETRKEEPYGTLALARMAMETFAKERRIIVLKNHGYVAIGTNLQEATRIIVDTHLRLLEKSMRDVRAP